MEKSQGVAKSAILVTVMMLSFKALGFLKQAIIAYYYGATVETDVYFIAWGFVFGVSEAIVKALSVSLVAIYTTLRVNSGETFANRLINGLVEVLFPIFMLLMILLLIFAPGFSLVLAPTYDYSEREMLILYIRILAPALLFGCIELVFGAVLDSHKSFFIPRLHSFIYSVSIIIACILFSKLIGIKALIIAQYFSSIVFSLLLFFSIRKYNRFFWVKLRKIPELRSIVVTAIPLFIGNSALQFNQIVDKSITSGLGDGVASALSYCHTLEQFVTNIMIVNIGNVMFANFAEFIAKENYTAVKNTLKNAVNYLIVLLTGISIVTVICAEDIVSIVYYRGNFSYEAVVLTSTALIGYSVSFVAVAVRDLTVKSLYAFKDTLHPMIASIASIIVNIILSITLSKYIGIFGVSLATSFSAIVGMIINAYYFKAHLIDYKYRDHLVKLITVLPSGILMGCVAGVVHNTIKIGCFGNFFITTIAAFSTYFFVLYITKNEEVRVTTKAIQKRISSNN